MYVCNFRLFCYCLTCSLIRLFRVFLFLFAVCAQANEGGGNKKEATVVCSVKVKPHKLLKNIAGIAVERFRTSKKTKINKLCQLINRNQINIGNSCAINCCVLTPVYSTSGVVWGCGRAE